jgi:osmotically-inducible protein OsmY
MLRPYKWLVLVVFALFMNGCTVHSKTESMGEYLDSSATTARVKARLIDNLGANGFEIQVKTYKDEVQLSGFVNSANIKQRAGKIAANTAGVKRVSNNLLVK